MHTLAILVASFLSTLTLALPLGPGPEKENTFCLNQNLTGDFPYTNNFLFKLFSVSKANNSDQTELALRSDMAPEIQGPRTSYMVTADAIYIDSQDFFISNGGIKALYPGDSGVVGVSTTVENDSELSFVSGEVDEILVPAEAYCVEVSPEFVGNWTRPEVYTYALAVNQTSELFSLCKSDPNELGFTVVYNQSSTGSWTNCTAVDIYLLPFSI